MTCILETRNILTKKTLKEYVKANGDFMLSDPSIFAPYYGKASTYLLLNPNGFTITNHPKRSWFAYVNSDMKVA
jgi:hypothetical protein